MRIDVSARGMDLTDSVRGYAEEKAERLPRYYDGVEQILVVVEHEGSGRFSTEFRVDAEKHDTFVGLASAGSAFASIDLSLDKVARQLKDFKERLKNSKPNTSSSGQMR